MFEEALIGIPVVMGVGGKGKMGRGKEIIFTATTTTTQK
jgi:hypothetical protein